jgi:hypothetical protein
MLLVYLLRRQYLLQVVWVRLSHNRLLWGISEIESLNKKNVYGPRKKVVACKIYNDKNEGDVNRKQFKQAIREDGQSD